MQLLGRRAPVICCMRRRRERERAFSRRAPSHGGLRQHLVHELNRRMPQISVAPLKAPQVYREPVVLQRYPDDILAWIAERRDEHGARCGVYWSERGGYRLGVRRD